MVVAWVTVQIEVRQALYTRSPCHSCYLDLYLVSMTIAEGQGMSNAHQANLGAIEYL